MQVLVIFAHPNHQSLNGAMLEQVKAGLEDNKSISAIRTIDLYQENFPAALIFNEQKRRRDMHTDADMASYREAVEWADKLVFIYPIWWGRPPAILLGFIDQVFAANFAYKQKGLLAEGLLKGKSAVCIATMKGPVIYMKLYLNNAHKILMKRALLQFVGIKKVKLFEFGSMEKKQGNQVRNLKKVKHYFQCLT